MPIGSSQWMYATSSDYDIPYSCRIPDDGKFTRTPGSAGNRRTWTWSGWLKLGYPESRNRAEFLFAYDTVPTNWYDTAFTSSMGLAGTGIRVDHSKAPSGSSVLNLKSPALMRDQSAWYHVVIIFDSTQGTNTNRLRVHVNGVQLGDWNEITWTSENFDGEINNAMPHTLGKGGNGDALGFSGYMAEVHMIDGTAVEPTSFGETGDYGEWKPKEYDVADGAYGTCGYYLDFSNASALGDDAAGSNDWTATNIAATDQMLDSPTNNFATMNPLTLSGGDAYNTSNAVLSEGNLTFDTTTGTTYFAAASTIPMLTGKWYAEIHCDVRDGTGSMVLGIQFEFNENYRTLQHPSEYANAWGYRSGGGGSSSGVFNNNSALSGTYGGFDVGDIISLAVDLDNDKFYVALNGVWQEQNPSGGSGLSLSAYTGKEAIFTCGATNATRKSGTWNFGQDSSFAGAKTAQGNGDYDFYYTPPSGFKALCTKDLPAVAVIPSEHFNTVLYDGDGNTTGNAITGVGFQPDFVWLKMRTANIRHMLWDVLRGVTKTFSTHTTPAEVTVDNFVSFDSDGFTVREHAVDGSDANDDGDTFVAWCWKAATAASGTTTGSGTGKAYSARYNTDAGFSMVTYLGNDTSGHTIPHHLSKAPEMIIVKAREHTDPWNVLHIGMASDYETDTMDMNATAGTEDNAGYWNDTKPTSSVFTLGSLNNVNADDEGHMAWCFHSVDGYSKVGSYEGNNDNDGTFVYTGFRPAFIIYKNVDASANWQIMDTTRSPYNQAYVSTQLNLSAIEWTETPGSGDFGLDFLSNGFKLREDEVISNDANTYLYIAFAETPFKYSNAR